MTGQTSYQQTYGAAGGYNASAMVPQQTQVPMQPVYQQPVAVSKKTQGVHTFLREVLFAVLSTGPVRNTCDKNKGG